MKKSCKYSLNKLAKNNFNPNSKTIGNRTKWMSEFDYKQQNTFKKIKNIVFYMQLKLSNTLIDSQIGKSCILYLES